MNLKYWFVGLKQPAVRNAKVIRWLNCLACQPLIATIRSLPGVLNYRLPIVDCRNAVVAAALATEKLSQKVVKGKRRDTIPGCATPLHQSLPKNVTNWGL